MAMSTIQSQQGFDYLLSIGRNPEGTEPDPQNPDGKQILRVNNPQLDGIAQNIFKGLKDNLANQESIGYISANAVTPGEVYFLMDWAEEEQVDADQLTNEVVKRVKGLLDNGRTLDPAWLPLLQNIKYFPEPENVTYLDRAMQNYADANRAVPDQLLDALLPKVGTIVSATSSSTIQKILQTALASGNALTAQLSQLVTRLASFNPADGARVAKQVLQSQIDNRQELDLNMLTILKVYEPDSVGPVIVAKAQAMVKAKSDLTLEVTHDYVLGTDGSSIYSELDKLKTASPPVYKSFANWILAYEIATTGNLDTTKHPIDSPFRVLLVWVKTNDKPGLKAILKQGLDQQAAQDAPLGSTLLAELRDMDPRATSNYVLAAAQKQITRAGHLRPDDVDALETYVLRTDSQSFESMAQYALANQFKRGLALTLPPPDPVPASETAQNRALWTMWTRLQELNPASATEWKASFDELGKGTAIAEIDLTPDQQLAIKAWSALLIKLTSQDPTIVEDTKPIVSSEVDLETALMTVFMGRATQLEAQLKAQIASVQAKNEQMGRMNDALGLLNKVQEMIDSDAKTSDKLSDKTGGKLTADLISQVNAALKAAGVTPWPAGFSGSLTRGELSGGIQQLKTQIDSLGNNQQTEMIRLQSLTTKRNEAFEIISSFLAKIAGVNEKILSHI